MGKFSSLNKLIPKRIHRERSQIRERKNLGHLEKHKDYIVRARKRKQAENDRKAMLRQIALSNEDQYNTTMKLSKKDTRTGKTIVKKINMPKLELHESVLEPWKQKQMNKLAKEEKPKKEQQMFIRKQAHSNMSILKVRQMILVKKIEKLRKELSFVGASIVANPDVEINGQPTQRETNRHIVFVKNKKKAEKFDPEQYFDTDPLLSKNVFNRPRKESLLSFKLPDKKYGKPTEVQTAEAYKKLEKYIEQERIITETIKNVEHAKNMALYSEKISNVVKETDDMEDVNGGEIDEWEMHPKMYAKLQKKKENRKMIIKSVEFKPTRMK